MSQHSAEAPTWSYFLEDYEGNVIKEVHNVPFQDAPRGAEEDDEGKILGHWFASSVVHPEAPTWSYFLSLLLKHIKFDPD